MSNILKFEEELTSLIFSMVLEVHWLTRCCCIMLILDLELHRYFRMTLFYIGFFILSAFLLTYRLLNHFKNKMKIHLKITFLQTHLILNISNMAANIVLVFIYCIQFASIMLKSFFK